MTRVIRYGRTALLLELEDGDETLGLYRAVRASGLPITEALPAARTVLLRFSDESTCDAALPLVHALTPLVADAGPSCEVTIPVSYDGADLERVAALTGLTIDDVVARHTDAVYDVAFIGFSPGFAYLTGIDPALHVPRLDSPRTRVPAGSVAIAGSYAAVYPTASPGGWHLLGHTDVRVFEADRDTPALLLPGTRVRFESVTQ